MDKQVLASSVSKMRFRRISYIAGNPGLFLCLLSFESYPISCIVVTLGCSKHYNNVDGFVQDCTNSSVLAMELLQSITKNHILQPQNYLIIVVNWFRYINNQFAKDKCSIPMDMTVVLGYHKFSLQATIDHHGPSIYSGHYTTSVNCCNRTFYCNDNKITEFDMINTKNSSTAYVVIYKLITQCFWTGTGGWEFNHSHGAGTSSPSHKQQVEE